MESVTFDVFSQKTGIEGGLGYDYFLTSRHFLAFFFAAQNVDLTVCALPPARECSLAPPPFLSHLSFSPENFFYVQVKINCWEVFPGV